ncbi:hypothetical protein H4R18_003631 [Coemansia javaensis]|uniref:peptide chain release factor N(5)-glutamine methyltransferase n=1 Tax=Coemansia javaensis TaxID=2761396 RepID=A0A9W8HD61_9FUNG|nr:hypothetical protein H4R18_003631 [Coemansia javaensis]
MPVAATDNDSDSDNDSSSSSGGGMNALCSRTAVVGAGSAGQKLRNYIVHEFRDLLAVRADSTAALRQKRVRVNGAVVLDSHVLAAGDRVQVQGDAARAIETRLRGLDVALRYSEPGLAVLLKAPGVNAPDAEWAAGALGVVGPRHAVTPGVVGPRHAVTPWLAVNQVEKSVRSLVLVADSEARRAAMAAHIAAGRVRFDLSAVCHGAVDQAAVDRAGGAVRDAETGGSARIAVEATTRSSGAGHLTLVRGAVTGAANPGLVLRRAMAALGCPVVGTQSAARPLRGQRDKGALLAFTRVEFPSPATGAPVAVDVGAAPKLLAVCAREARFHARRLAAARAEVERAAPGLGLGLGLGLGQAAAAAAAAWDVDMADGCPAAYVTGLKDFCGHTLRVTRDTLIPRASTETLVRAAVEQLELGLDPDLVPEPRVLDLGTGSGCVLVATLLRAASAAGTGVDISDAALAVARDNCQRHGLAQRCVLLHSSFEAFAEDAAVVARGPFDVIACNPPYVSPQRAAQMRAAAVREPALALVAEDGGYRAYRTVCASLERAPAVLRAGSGCLALEIGKGMERGVRAIFAAWTEVAALSDAHGFLRVLVFRRRG